MVNPHLSVLEFATQTHQHSDLKTLTTHFARVVDLFGFSSFMFTGLPRAGYDVAPLIICDYWPAGWTNRYSGQNYFADDPVGRWSLLKRRPFHWRQAQRFEGSTRRSRQIAGEAWEHGLADGIAYPLTNAVVSLAAEGNVEIDPMAEASIYLAVSYFKAAAEDLEHVSGRTPRPQLTSREIEVLKWAAGGKSAWETSRILAISESTVKHHRASIRRKFGVESTTQAIAVALNAGISLL